jgi:hypothetical protein
MCFSLVKRNHEPVIGSPSTVRHAPDRTASGATCEKQPLIESIFFGLTRFRPMCATWSSPGRALARGGLHLHRHKELMILSIYNNYGNELRLIGGKSINS